MKKTIQIRDRFDGLVIFTYESEAPTMCDAVLAALAAGTNLSGANLSGADLPWANLSWADLSWANLSRADLSWANLSGANLSRANLSGANLSRANLSGANLSRADLSGALRTPIFCRWRHGITDGKVHIGCEARTVEEWDAFFDSDDVISTRRGTSDFAQIHAVFAAYKAYLATLKTYGDVK